MAILIRKVSLQKFRKERINKNVTKKQLKINRQWYSLWISFGFYLSGKRLENSNNSTCLCSKDSIYFFLEIKLVEYLSGIALTFSLSVSQPFFVYLLNLFLLWQSFQSFASFMLLSGVNLSCRVGGKGQGGHPGTELWHCLGMRLQKLHTWDLQRLLHL